mgnify:CR=1 FL=1
MSVCSAMSAILVLIETYWNVNFSILFSVDLLTPVLIETYWNVNMKRHALSVGQEIVLIETYWNVNYFVSISCNVVASINRNILECK